MKFETMEEYVNRMYPPECRFVISLQESYLLTDGRRVSNRSRRFRLADCAEDARQSVQDEINRRFNGKENQAEIISVQAVPQAVVFTLGYCRFNSDNDIRKTK